MKNTIRLATITLALTLGACASTSGKIEESKPHKYDADNSFALNLMEAVNVDLRIDDAERAEDGGYNDSRVGNTLIGGAGAYLLGGKFLEGAIGGYIAPINKMADRDYAIMAIELQNPDDARIEITKMIQEEMLKRSPDATFSEVEYGKFTSFWEYSEACNTNKAFNEERIPWSIAVEVGRRHEGCEITLEIVATRPASEPFFDDPEGKTIIRIRELSARKIQELLPEGYYEYRATRVEKTRHDTGKFAPAHIRLGDKAWLFVKPEGATPDEQAVPRESLAKDDEVASFYK